MKSLRHAEVNLHPFVTSTLGARDFPAARSTRKYLIILHKRTAKPTQIFGSENGYYEKLTGKDWKSKK
jgi:hypothetical protein